MQIHSFPSNKSLIPFTPGSAQRGVTALCLALSILSVFADLLVVYALARLVFIPRKSSSNTIAVVGSRMILSMCIADCLYSMMMVFSLSLNLRYGGWASGILGCIVTGEFLIYLQSISFYMLLGLSIERYCIVHQKFNFTSFHANLIVASAWIGLAVIETYPIWTGAYVYMAELAPSKVFCSIAFHDHHPLTLFATITLSSFLTLGAFFLLYVYSSIFMSLRKSSSQGQAAATRRHSLVNKVSAASSIPASLSKSPPSSPNPSSFTTTPTKIMMNLLIQSPRTTISSSKQEQRLFIKCVAITGCFLIFWAPSLLNMIYALFSKKVHGESFDGLAVVCIHAYILSNALLLVGLDVYLYREVADLYSKGWEWWTAGRLACCAAGLGRYTTYSRRGGPTTSETVLPCTMPRLHHSGGRNENYK